MASEPIRFSRRSTGAEPDASSQSTLASTTTMLDMGQTPSATHTVAITQVLEQRVQALEQQFRDLDSELRRRFGNRSYSVDRSEQVLGAIQRLSWAISRSPVAIPFLPTTDASPAESE